MTFSNQNVKQLGSRSSTTQCRAWSGYILFSKVVSRRQKSWLAEKDSSYNNGPRCEKTCLRSFGQSQTKISLSSYRVWLECWHFTCSKFRYDTIQYAKKEGTDQTARMRRLSAHLLFTNAEDRFSRVKAQFYNISLQLYFRGKKFTYQDLWRRIVTLSVEFKQLVPVHWGYFQTESGIKLMRSLPNQNFKI